MKPDVAPVLAEMAGLLVRNADPSVDPADRASALGLTAALMGFAAAAWDSQAHNLFEENREFRGVLGLAGADENLRISALSAENARLRQALIEAQARAESEDPTLAEAIWAVLRASTERWMVPGSPV